MARLWGSLWICLSLIANVFAIGGCWFDDDDVICSNTANTTKEVNTTTHELLADQMTWCQEECVKLEADTSLPLCSCKYFTVQKEDGKVNCHLLPYCIREWDECLDTGTCGSGLGDCSACPALPSYPGKIPWVCDHIENPYEEVIPVGTTCILSCNGWLTANGTAVTVSSSCYYRNWTDSAIMQTGVTQNDVPALPKDLPKPNDSADNQIDCSCGPKNMAWTPKTPSSELDHIDYNPNTLPGTTFICENGDYIVEDPEAGGQAAFIMAEDMTCRLYCDGYHVATMECRNGAWTGHPELGAWCYYEPTEKDDMGPFEPNPANP